MQLLAQPIFTITDGDGAVGSEVCLDITGDDFDNIFGFQFTVEYDPNVLEFASGMGEVLSNAPVSVTNTAPGEIRVRWDLFSLEGLSAMEPFTIATVCFNVLSDVETDVFFSGSSIAQEVIGEAGPIAGVTYDDGVVNEGNTGGGGGPSAVFMDFSEEQIVPGQTLCQEVTVSDFTDISTFSFAINNPLGSVATPSLQNVNASLTGTLSLMGTTTATISYDHGGGSVSLTNGTVAFELCHEIPAGYTDPNPQTITGDGAGTATTGMGEMTSVNVVSGTASPPITGGSGDLTFSLSDEDGAVGEQVCLELTTENHTDITAWQFSLNFNTSFLTYTNFIPNPAYAGQNSDIQVFGSGPGELRVIWSDGTPELDGFTFANGTVLATFCFDIVNAGPTTVDITNNPIEIVAANASGQQLTVVTNDGSVNGGITSTCNNGVQDGSETGVDCGGPDCDPCVSCNDGIQNGNETGVDCGGPDCSPCDPVIGDNLTFDLQDGSGDVGDQVCLDITTFNFTDITAFQFSVNFDNAVLSFVSSSYAQEFDDAFSPVSINEDSGGDLRITWVDQFLEGLTFDDGEVVITLCFEILDDGPTNIALSGNPIQATGSEVGGAGVDVDVLGGTVNGSGQQPTCNDSIQNGNETGVDCGGSCAPCMTMADCNDGVQNGQETGVDCGGPDCTPCTTDLVFDLLDATCDGNGNLCMDLMVTGFTSITGFEFKVNFDDALLDFDADNFSFVQAFDDVFSPVSVNQSGTGQISVLWSYNNPDFLGSTFTDGSVVMTFCFTGFNTGNSTVLSLSDLTGVDNTGLGVDVQGFGATASCGGTVDPCNNGIQDGQETGVDCGGPDCGPCPPTCNDGIQNGDETGVDCGGSCQPCMVMATCDDGMQNGQETGVDCGGPDCTPCTTDLVFDLLDATCDENGEVCVDLIVTGFTNITGFQFEVLFDPDELTYESFMADPAFMAIFSPVNVTNPEPGELQILWVDNSPTFQGLTFDDGDQIIKFCFSNVADGQSTLTLNDLTASDNTGMSIPVFGFGATVTCGGDDPCNNGIQDGNETGVDCGGDCDPCPPDPCSNGVQDGQETGVDCGGPDCVPCETDLTFTLANGTGGVGEEVCVDITAFDFDEITGFQFSINYDPELLDFESGTGNTSLPGLIAIDGSPGQVTVRWTGSSAVSLSNGDAVANLCFTVLGPDVCTANVVFSDSPTPISANNQDGDNITVITNNGVINSGNPCADPPPNLVLDIGDATGAEGTQICLDVTVTDFIDITDLQFSVTYDASMLTFTGGGDFNLSGVGASNFNSTPGEITFDWESPGPNGVTVTNGTAIFSLCFTVDEMGETVVQPSNSPLVILATNGTNQSVGVVPSAGIVNAGIPIGDALSFIIGNANGDVGDIVCVPMTVFNFDALAGFQFGIEYDPAQIRFDDRIVPTCPTNGGPVFDCLPGFFPPNVTNPNPGDIRVSWDDQMLMDRQLEDGSVIFELCFEVLTTDCAPVFFGTIIAQQFFNADVQLLPATIINGGINCAGQPPVVNEATVNNTSCDRNDDGSISLSVLGGPNLTYSWTHDEDADGPTVENLTPGFYTVIITNPSTGEFTSETFNIGSDPSFDLTTSNVTDVRCFGENNGSITIATVGGVAPFTIDWCGNLQDNQIQQNNLFEGTYCVTVTDANGCSREINEIDIDEPDSIAMTRVITEITGPGTGAINLDVDGGTPGYTYQWTGPNNFMSDNEDLSGLDDPGTYCVTVTDSRGCVEPRCFNLTEPNCMPTFDVDAQIPCFGETNGSIDLTVASNCTGILIAVVWTDENGTIIATTEDVDDLGPGTYSFAISQGTSTVTGNVSLGENSLIDTMDSATVITNSTNGNNGAIDITPNGGGLQPYSYTWTDEDGTVISDDQDISGLAGGTYCVVITDDIGCSSEQRCFTVPTAPMALISQSDNDALCADSLGFVEIGVSNAVLPLSATAEPGGFTSTSSASTITLDLPAGTYDVTVTDAQGQMITVTGVLIEAPAPVTLDQDPIVVSNVDEATCSGSITLNLIGGTPELDVSWNQPGLSGPQIMQLCDGTYRPTVTDANGCEYVLDEIVVGLLSGGGTTSLVDCPGDSTGTVDLTVEGGESPYTYSWTMAGNPDFSADTEDLQNVREGTYTVIITDATGAQLMRVFEVETAAGFSVSTAVTSSYNGFGVSCPNSSDGSLAATISGVGEFSYEWRRNGSLIGDDSPTLSNVPAGEYTLIVTSDVGCIVEETLILTEPDPIQIVANITDASCDDARDGRITLEVSGGVGSPDFFWDNTRTTPTINFLLPGPYSVEVSDENDCFVTQTFRVEAPEVLAATAISTDATDDCNGTVNVEVTGGNGEYTYQWPQLLNQTGPSAEGLCPGEYMVVIRDLGGCQSITVSVLVRDRRFPCLSSREVITPNGDGLNEDFVLFCTDGEGFNDNTLEIFNRWGQLVFTVDNYDCSQDGGSNCFNGTNNDGTELPEGPYYFVLDYANPSGDREQLRGSLTILRE